MAKPKYLYFLEKSAFAEEKFHIKMMQKCGCRLNVHISMPKNQPEFGNRYTKKKKTEKRKNMHEQYPLYQSGEPCCFVCRNYFTCTKNINNHAVDLKTACDSLVLVTESKGGDPP